MYSIAEIFTGLRNPERVKRKAVKSGYKYVAHPAVNTKARFKNRETDSSVGLVVNWGFHHFDQWPVAEYPFLVRAIVDRFDPIVIPSQQAYQRQKHRLDAIIAFEPDQWMAPRISYDTSCNHRIGLITGHPHTKGEWFPKYIRSNDIDSILCRYYQPFVHYFPELASECLVHFPWSMPEAFVIDPDEIRCHDQSELHVFGTYGHEMYDTREAVREYPFVNTSMRYDSGHTVSKPLGFKDYYRWCRNFDAMVAAGSLEPKYQYTFAKYFEIPAAGSLLFAQYCEDLERLGFDGSNSVIFDSLDAFEQKADAYLEDPSAYLPKRRRGAELIRSRHTVSDRIETLQDVLHIRR